MFYLLTFFSFFLKGDRDTFYEEHEQGRTETYSVLPQGFESYPHIDEAGKIVASVHQLLTDEKIYKEMAIAHNPYGDGRASIRIKEFLESNDLGKK